MFPAEYLYLTELDEKDLFINANIYFDASALLNFYNFSDQAIEDIFSKLIISSKDRLFITDQNWFEYNKNRSNVLLKPINSYKKLTNSINVGNKAVNNDGDHLAKLISGLEKMQTADLKKIKEHSNQLTTKTFKENTHPYLSEDIRNRLENQIQTVEEFFNKEIKKTVEEYKIISQELNAEIEEQIEKIRGRETNDIIQQQIKLHFNTTKINFKFNQLMEIASEGEFRYKHKIPPGYGDLNDKNGIQVFGDLISWKELLQHVQKKKVPSIYVTNDNKDMISEESNGPKIDLIKEYYDVTGERFWLFHLTDFLHLLNRYSISKLETNTTNEIKDFEEEMQERFKKNILEHTENRVSELYFLNSLKQMLSSKYVIEGDPLHDSTIRGKGFSSFVFNATDHDFDSASNTLLIFTKIEDNLGMQGYLRVLPDKAYNYLKRNKYKVEMYICISSYEYYCDIHKQEGFREEFKRVVNLLSDNKIDVYFASYEENITNSISNLI